MMSIAFVTIVLFGTLNTFNTFNTFNAVNGLTIQVKNITAGRWKSSTSATSKPVIELELPSTTVRNEIKWNFEEYPNPDTESSKCHVASNSSKNQFRTLLCDPDGILETHEIEKLGTILREISAVPKCYCKICTQDGRTSIPVGVALARNIFENYNEPENESNQQFANKLRQKWQVGFCDNSILILLVVGSKNLMLTTSVGEIAGGVMDSTVIQGFTNSTSVNEDFQHRQVFKGLSFILHGMKNFLKNVQKAPQIRNNSKIGGPGVEDANNEPGPERNPSQETAVFVLGAVTAFLLLLTILIGLLVHTKTKLERIPVATDPGTDRAQGYFTGNQTQPKTLEGTEAQWSQTKAGNETPNGTRRVDTVNGPVNYEPVSIEDHEEPEEPTSSQIIPNRKFSRKDSEEHSNLHGKDELLEQTDQISIASNKQTSESKL